jgi:hypothetical protein
MRGVSKAGRVDAASTLLQKQETMSTAHRTVICLLSAAGLLIASAASADPVQAPSALCGDQEKDVKKPKDDKKKNPNPASVEQLCGGDKKKDVKKPTDDDKKQPSPACGGDCDCDKKGKKGDKKNPS